MKKLFFLLIGVLLFGANLINVDFFSHKNFVDILLSFDSKFDGKVIKIDNHTYLLKGAVTNREYSKTFDAGFLKKIDVKPQKNGILVKLDTKKDTKISFALTPEGYGIRIRVQNLKKPIDQIQNLTAQNPESSIDYFTYFIILAILVILAIILWIVRKKAPKLPIKKSELSMGVLVQKPIDAKNKIVLFEFNKRRYLMLVGNTNLLLDVFDEELQTVNVSTQKDFDDFLKLNNKMDEIKKYIKNAEELKEFDETI
jgi:flagellar biogenesis protein FliO